MKTFLTTAAALGLVALMSTAAHATTWTGDDWRTTEGKIDPGAVVYKDGIGLSVFGSTGLRPEWAYYDKNPALGGLTNSADPASPCGDNMCGKLERLNFLFHTKNPIDPSRISFELNGDHKVYTGTPEITYLRHLFGKQLVSVSSPFVGAYVAAANVAPIPLPAGGLLLLCGLMLMRAVSRTKRLVRGCGRATA